MKKDTAEIRQIVRKHYSKVATGSSCGCGSTETAETGCCLPDQALSRGYNTALGYSAEDLNTSVDGTNMNLGCGNPIAIGKLQPGEKVLDLGCGGGFDSFLAAKAVGPEGHVIGVDMTPEMIEKARVNQNKIGSQNVSFRLGEIEHLPVADGAVDVILSNCVINLSPNKSQVWREAFRALRPGGRCAVSDIVALDTLPDSLKKKLELITGCISGAEQVDIIQQQIEAAGFENVQIQIKPESKKFIRSWFPESGVERYVASANIEAYKPVPPILQIPEGQDWIAEIKEKAEQNMRRYGNCTQSIVSAFIDVLGVEEPNLSRLSSGFLGGMTHSHTCGIHTAGVLLLGFVHGRDRLEEGMDTLYPVILAIRELFQQLGETFGSHSCKELTGVDFTNPRQAARFQKSEESKKCITMVGEGAEIIALILQNLNEEGGFMEQVSRTSKCAN